MDERLEEPAEHSRQETVAESERLFSCPSHASKRPTCPHSAGSIPVRYRFPGVVIITEANLSPASPELLDLLENLPEKGYIYIYGIVNNLYKPPDHYVFSQRTEGQG